MTTIALVGAGAVGTRAARQLADTPGIKRLLIADRSRAQARDLADRVGGEAVSLSADGLMGANAVALTIPSSAAARLAKKSFLLEFLSPPLPTTRLAPRRCLPSTG